MENGYMMKFSNKKIISILNKLLIAFIASQIIVTSISFVLEKQGIDEYEDAVFPFYEIFRFSTILNLKEKVEVIIPESPKMITKTIQTEEIRQDPYVLNAVFLGSAGNFIAIDDTKKVEFVDLGKQYKIYKLVDIKIDKAIFEVYGKKYTLEVAKNGTLPRKEIVTSTITEIDQTSVKPQTPLVTQKKIDRYVAVNKNDVQQYATNFTQIWKDIKIKEVRQNGVIIGFDIKEISPSSLFAKLGLEQGDLIVSVNNKKITKYSEAFYFYRNILKYKSLKITVLRNNQQKDIEYAIGN